MFRLGDAIRQALRIEAEQLNIISSNRPLSCAKEDETERLPEDKEAPREESPSILVRDEKIDNTMEGYKKVIGQGSGGVPPSDSDDDRSEGVRRTKTLEELGIGVPSKRKRIPTPRAPQYMKMKRRHRAPKVARDSTGVMATLLPCQPLAIIPHSSIQGEVVMKEETRPKRKIFPTQRASEYLKMKRRHTSLKVAMGITDMVTTPATCQSLASSTRSSVLKISGRKELGNIDSTEDNDAPPVSSDNARNIESSSMPAVTGCDYSDGLSNLPIVNENLAGLSSTYVSGASQIHQLGAAAKSGQGSHVEIPFLGNEELVEYESATSAAATAVIMSSGIEKGNPKCNLKEKGTSRTASKSNWCLASFKPTTVNAEPVTSESLIAYCWSAPSDHTISQKYQPIEYSRGGVYDPVENLFDIDLMVKVSSRQENGPYISVMSKVNNRPITGHALNTEALDDGFCNDLISGSGCFTGRSDEEEDAPVSQGANKDEKGKLNPSVGKIYKHGPYKPRKKVTFGKLTRYRESGHVPRKLSRLSSVVAASDKQCPEEVRSPLVMKPKAPVIYCVPLKLTFSRINEALRS